MTFPPPGWFKYFKIIVKNIEYIIDIIKFWGIIILKSGLFW
jgi:hypothetical protein